MLTDNQRGEMINRQRLYPPHPGVTTTKCIY